jgi:hypothetical protein
MSLAAFWPHSHGNERGPCDRGASEKAEIPRFCGLDAVS